MWYDFSQWALIGCGRLLACLATLCYVCIFTR